MFNSDNSYELFGECQSTNPGVYTNYTMNICHGKYYHRIKYRFATTQELYLEDGNGKKLAETQYIGNGAVFTDMDGKIISRFNLVQQRMFKITEHFKEWSSFTIGLGDTAAKPTLFVYFPCPVKLGKCS